MISRSVASVRKGGQPPTPPPLNFQSSYGPDKHNVCLLIVSLVTCFVGPKTGPVLLNRSRDWGNFNISPIPWAQCLLPRLTSNILCWPNGGSHTLNRMIEVTWTPSLTPSPNAQCLLPYRATSDVLCWSRTLYSWCIIIWNSCSFSRFSGWNPCSAFIS